MTVAIASKDIQKAILHFKVRSRALERMQEDRRFDSVQAFCDRINALRAKSDGELEALGVDREDIGAHVIRSLLT